MDILVLEKLARTYYSGTDFFFHLCPYLTLDTPLSESCEDPYKCTTNCVFSKNDALVIAKEISNT